MHRPALFSKSWRKYRKTAARNAACRVYPATDFLSGTRENNPQKISPGSAGGSMLYNQADMQAKARLVRAGKNP